jgi:acetate kinase
MADAIVVLNAGSSSIKFSVFRLDADSPALAVRGQIEGIYTSARFVAKSPSGATVATRSWDGEGPLGHDGAIRFLIDYLHGELDGHRVLAVGHRVVHGGTDYDRPVRLDGALVEELERFVPLAPLHQPHNLAAIRALLARAPELAQVACFDTSFHRRMPTVAQTFALPPAITDRGVRRYGFHGLSYEYIAATLPGLDAAAARGRVVVAHLGNGASMCAIANGRSVASTMGFTAVEGLPMGTRSGALDPGVILYLMDELKMDARAIEKLIYQQSGLLGVSGVSSDMRTLLASDDPRAAFAVELFCYRIHRELGSLSAAMGGLDALVFTGGIGEHAAPVRARVLQLAAWLGIDADPDANATHGPQLTKAGSRTRAWVIPTDEELMIARHTRAVIDAG